MPHSPGNWTVTVNPRGQTFITSDFTVIATTDCSYFFKAHRLVSDPDTIAANAKLLASAPLLAKALKACADRLGEMDCGPELDAARAALILAGVENA